MTASKDQEVNIAQWIANAIADTGCTVVFGMFFSSCVLCVDENVSFLTFEYISRWTRWCVGAHGKCRLSAPQSHMGLRSQRA